MIITENVFAIEEKVTELAKIIRQSEQAQEFYLAKKRVSEDVEAANLEKNLRCAYDEFVSIEKYGSYAPDYPVKKQAFYQAKKAYDLCDSVANLRQAQMSVQTILDEIAVKIAQVVSDTILVETGNPFFENGQKKSCTKGCSLS